MHSLVQSLILDLQLGLWTSDFSRKQMVLNVFSTMLLDRNSYMSSFLVTRKFPGVFIIINIIRELSPISERTDSYLAPGCGVLIQIIIKLSVTPYWSKIIYNSTIHRVRLTHEYRLGFRTWGLFIWSETFSVDGQSQCDW